MTVNRTTLLDLPLPVSGTESGTWGDTTNNGLTQYMDIAIAGMSNLTSANFAAGALTIETTEGTSSATNITATSAQYAGFRVTSLATNSTITVGNTGTSPARSYRLINADATYSLTFKATGQTGVTLLPGQSALVAFNGTDYVIVGVVGAGSTTDNTVPRFDGTTGEILQSSGITIDDSNNVSGVGVLNATTLDATNIEVTNIKAKDGTAAASIADATGVITVSQAPVMSALTASQAVFTDGSKGLVSNAITGTGNVVMSGSPTLTGTVAGASLQLSSLTSSRVTYAGTSGLLQDSANLTFNGTDLTVSGAVNAGTVNATTFDMTNLEVTNIKAKDGTAAASIADSTGIITITTQLNVDNLNLSGNTLSSTDANGNIVLAPNGTGDVQVDADTVRIGDSNANATLTTNGTGDLILNTNSGTNSGSITIQDGVDGNIVIAPNGNGQVQITNALIDVTTIEVTNIKAKDGTAAITIADSTGVVTVSSQLQVDNINISTNTISSTDTNGNIEVAPNGNGSVVITNTGTSNALRITQTGSGNALLVEDSANPDATPFVVDSIGIVLAGYTVNIDSSQLQTFNGGQTNFRWNAASTGPSSNFKKSRSATIGSYSVVSAGDVLGSLRWFGDDGVAFSEAASIASAVDGTPGTNDMPGRLVFSTTADGGSSPIERMRIDSAGNVGIGTTAPAGRSLIVSKIITGSTTSRGIISSGEAQSDVTSEVTYYSSSANTAAASFTLANLLHYNALQGTFGAGSTVTNQYGFYAQSNLTGATNNFGFYSNIASGTGRYNFYANGTASNYFGGNTIISVADNTNAALRITQTGTGDAILVEDSANPDSSPFVVDTNGRVIAGYTASLAQQGVTAQIQNNGTSAGQGGGTVSNTYWQNNTTGPALLLNKSRSATPGSYTVVQSGDGLGIVAFGGDDGTAIIRGAAITAEVDGTPGTNDMPGRLIFSTTADGASSPTERMRIDNAGNVGIGLTPVANNGILQLNSYASVQAMMEKATVSATAATGTINFDAATQPVLYYTTNSSGNWTINIRGSASLSLNSMMQTGQSLTLAFLATNGSTAYYQSALTIDGSSVTPKWQGGTAPTAGNASSIDAYVLTVIKTGSATFTVLASQTKFA